ncbi:MAG: NfeD family protein [Mycetocola sp.]
MLIEFLTTHSWVIWVSIALILLIVEMLTLDFIFLMMAIGSGVGLVTDLAGAPWWLSIIVAAVTALLLIVFLRRPLRNALHRRGDDPASNVDAVRGSGAVALSVITVGGGQVRLSNGEQWTARAAAGDIPAGTVLTVVEVDGAHVIVREQGK